MSTTHNHGIELVGKNQSSKEVTLAIGLNRVDALLNLKIQDRTLTAPPVSPSNGHQYIPAATATGDWAGQEGKIAYYSSGWYFVSPERGFTATLIGEDNKMVVYDGSGWDTVLPQQRDSTELTIASGTITVTRDMHTVDTEADAASDDLNTINGLEIGQSVLITLENSSRTVVLKASGGNLNIGADITIDQSYKAVRLTRIASGNNIIAEPNF